MLSTHIEKLSRLNESSYTAHEIVRVRYSKDTNRLTVQMMLIVDGCQVLLVQSAKDRTGQTWGMPQGGVTSRDQCLMSATARECGEELGLMKTCLSYERARVLGEWINPLPRERGGGAKHIVVLAVPANIHDVRLNEENSGFQLVDSLSKLRACMKAARELKRVMTVAACHAARQEGMLVEHFFA